MLEPLDRDVRAAIAWLRRLRDGLRFDYCDRLNCALRKNGWHGHPADEPESAS